MKYPARVILLSLFPILAVLLAPNFVQAAAKTYTLTVVKSGSGSGVIASSPVGIDCGESCSAGFKVKTSVILTAMAAPGSIFEGWSGACTGNASTCTVLMKKAKSVTARFALIKMALNVNITGSGAGIVTSSPVGIDCGPICSADFIQDSEVTLTATPATGSTFGGWSGACTGSDNACVVTLSQARTLYAYFSEPAVTTYQYDPNGNLTQASDPLGNIRQVEYDSLDRVIRQLEPHPSAAGSTLGQIDTDYDSLGQLTRITDPRNLATDYQIDNLGNLVSRTSPDTGFTQFTYDEAGNLKTRTDARGKTATYSYDSQNRLTQTAYDDQTVTYTWDTCSQGIGRLCSLTNAGSVLRFSYDPHGRITGKSQTVGSVTLSASHSYNSLGQLEQTLTPGGQTIDYLWLNGRIEAINLNGQELISRIAYEPDGQIGGWTWSNGEPSERLYDLSGRPVAIDLGIDAQSQRPDTRHYGYDAAGRITDILSETDPHLNQNHDYDGLDRLITSRQGETVVLSRFDYAYDLSGNRTGKVLNNSTAETYTIDPGSNRLQAKSGAQTRNYSHDAAGNLTGDGTITFTYNAEGRRISATAPTLNAVYAYNALDQRVKKTVNGETALFFYDEQGHLLGEYDAAGQLAQEIVWFGELPIAVVKSAAPPSDAIEIFYLHADHLTTPRKITRPSDNKVLWTWESEAFGDSPPNQNPSSLGEFVFNLRFPGQYYDQETGLHYNYFRDYDPGTGRYIESDPIGLAGGLNTYVYVNGNPINYFDPFGLDPLCAENGQRIDCTDGMRPPPAGTPLNGPLSPVGVASTVAETLLAVCPIGRGAQSAKTIANPVPDMLARVVPKGLNPTTLGKVGEVDVFVANASELRGLSNAQIAEKLSIPEVPGGFKVIEFPSSSVDGIASPVNRTNNGFVMGGQTAGGAAEFVVPNGPIPVGAIQWIPK